MNDAKVAATRHAKASAKDGLTASTAGRIYVNMAARVTAPIEPPDQAELMNRPTRPSWWHAIYAGGTGWGINVSLSGYCSYFIIVRPSSVFLSFPLPTLIIVDNCVLPGIVFYLLFRSFFYLFCLKWFFLRFAPLILCPHTPPPTVFSEFRLPLSVVRLSSFYFLSIYFNQLLVILLLLYQYIFISVSALPGVSFIPLWPRAGLEQSAQVRKINQSINQIRNLLRKNHTSSTTECTLLLLMLLLLVQLLLYYYYY